MTDPERPWLNVLYGRCLTKGCGNVWLIAAMPMPLEKATKIMRGAACGKCSAREIAVASNAEVAAEIFRPWKEAAELLKAQFKEAAEEGSETNAAVRMLL